MDPFTRNPNREPGVSLFTCILEMMIYDQPVFSFERSSLCIVAVNVTIISKAKIIVADETFSSKMLYIQLLTVL